MRHAVVADRRQPARPGKLFPADRIGAGGGRMSRTTPRSTRTARADDWLAPVAAAAASGTAVPAELLGEYLPMLADAAVHGRRPDAWQLEAVRESGRQAAARGVDARRAVDLYLSAAWRLWRQLPVVARSSDPDKVRAAAEAVLRVLDDAVGVLVDGHQSERRAMIRREEALRAEFVDDLLRGDADVAGLVQRAEPFGIDLGKSHHVALVAPRDDQAAPDRAAIVLERAVVGRFGDREVLVALKDGRVVLVLPGAPASAPQGGDIGAVVQEDLRRPGVGGRWRVAAGRAFPGAYGIARSYEEAREALGLADRLGLESDVVDVRDLLVYRVLARDQSAIVDLIRDVLGPLQSARGGARPLLETLEAYFAAGDVATEAARRLHVSVRTVTYRLARVAALTGYGMSDPGQRFSLQTAVLGARLLEWPARPLPAEP
jgi:sugar diacid utilization regulator